MPATERDELIAFELRRRDMVGRLFKAKELGLGHFFMLQAIVNDVY